MRVLPGQTRSSVAAVLACLIVLAPETALTDESAGHSPFGVLKRESFIGGAPPGMAEHEALFSRPSEATTDAWGTAAQSSTPADDVVFAAPVLSVVRETGTSPTNRLVPPSPPEEPAKETWNAAQSSRPADDVVFAAPVLPAAQEIATGSTNRLVPPSPSEAPAKDGWGVGAQSSRPAADVLFAAPVFLTGQEIATAPTNTVSPATPPEEATRDAWGAATEAGTPAADVVFAAPVLPTGQETVAGPTATFVPPSRSAEATTDAAGAVQSNTPAGDVVFAAPALPVGQETVTGPTSTLLPPPLIAATVDAVVFGPPSGGADSGSMSDRPADTSSTPEPQSGAASLPALAPEKAARLKTRARALLANGSVAPARALLEQAASRGDAEGEYLLAQTYDPEALTRAGMIGVAGDAARAEALYRAAQLGGYPRPDKNARAAQP